MFSDPRWYQPTNDAVETSRIHKYHRSKLGRFPNYIPIKREHNRIINDLRLWMTLNRYIFNGHNTWISLSCLLQIVIVYHHNNQWYHWWYMIINSNNYNVHYHVMTIVSIYYESFPFSKWIMGWGHNRSWRHAEATCSWGRLLPYTDHLQSTKPCSHHIPRSTW